MEPLKIEPTLKTPYILFDASTGIFDIKGMSCAEYAREFYAPINEWLDSYSKNPLSETIVNIQFKYFNTSSAKSLLLLLQKLKAIKSNGYNVAINWFYEKNDEQMIQDGENYSEILSLPFNLKEIEQ
ncbi:MAG TPA: DUF1987 domain-containing protein [Cytophagales bacterium]|nr:DUF1987 domain-containing protein [Cytophagales bacterium]